MTRFSDSPAGARPPAPEALPGGTILRALSGAARATEDAPRPRSTPERVLGSLLAPLGSVELAHQLAELSSPGPTTPQDTPAPEPGLAERARALRERTYRRIEELRASADEPLHSPFEGKLPLAGAAAVHARIEELCAERTEGRGHRDRSLRGNEIREAARDLAGPFHDRVGVAVRRARGLVTGVRLRIRDEVRALCAAAAHLEELDALVNEHTAVKTAALFDRIPALLSRGFEAELALAVRDAPDPPPREYTDAAFAEGGWIAAHIRRCRQVALAAFEHERRAVWGFVTAATELAGNSAEGGADTGDRHTATRNEVTES